MADDDIFGEDFLNLEANHQKEGFDEGYREGLIAGKEEAKPTGIKTGFEVGEELGFYKGCVDVWNSAIRVDPTRFSHRVQKTVRQMEELIEKYPIMEPEDESVGDVMEALRLKFRAVCASLVGDEQEGGNMLKAMLGCCKVYISESRNRAALDSIERAAKLFSEARIVNKFEDETYNRVGYTLISKLAPRPSADRCPLRMAVLAMVKAAISSLPTFLYGAAHEEGRTLDSVWRELGYFKPNSSGEQWQLGGVDNYNVPVVSTDIASVRRIAKHVSGRGTGLASVQAMAPAHGESVIEVACNLLEPEKVGGGRDKKKKKTIDQSMLLCCKHFISELRNLASVIINKFEDRAYNRVWYTIVSYVMHDSSGSAIYSPLQQTVMKMAEAAFGAINLEQHSGAHPRLGVVDDIVFHPFARASLDEAAWLAKAVAVDIGNIFQGCSYAAVHLTGKALDTIGRELGYYKPNFMGSQWAGWPMPDGISMIRGRPWVALYNIPVLSTDVAATQLVARMVNARGGGLPTVQTLGLVHGEDSTETACMLLEPNPVGVDRVQNHIEMLAAQEGLDVEKGYFTDHSPDMIIEKYMKLISSAEQ
ncbi:formimidoyltransferase-cyclodeaminase-like [Pyrus ussuriensis x Pyrus communis]|uniref:Formimidoyltransferase-cyclodeaminase-like n=1 Tax=Pyrus ussuriensis x Pyrus communis TaxID=2448454 RepID=A0A5N5GAR3_9ROSA|nr:formimidoyltransferase-cyclodeaminase-like [Pyrus ussuriensis x Pyrus communis]